MTDAAAKSVFEAVIAPHQSLSARGARYVIGGITLLASLITFFACWLVHAWPVIGFAVVEVGFAALLLRWQGKRSARSIEFLSLSERELRIVRTGPRGRRREKILPVAWLHAVLEEHPGQAPRLWLTARGVREQIGETLGEGEKRDLGAALSTALYRLHHPVFDNPQLRS